MSQLKRSLPVLVFAAFPLLLGGLVWWLLSPTPSPEDAIREAIYDAAEGARERDLKATLAPVSQAYRDADGLGRDQLAGFLFREFQARGPIGVVISPIEVRIDEEARSATSTIEAALTEGVDLTAFDLLPESADLLHFTVDWQLEGEDWMIVSHERAPVR